MVRNPELLYPIARLVQVDHIFTFTMDTLSTLKTETLGYADRIENGSFHVRVERMGHRGEIDGRRIEQDLAAALIESLTQRSCTPQVDFHDPDAFSTSKSSAMNVGWDSSQGRCVSSAHL